MAKELGRERRSAEPCADQSCQTPLAGVSPLPQRSPVAEADRVDERRARWQIPSVPTQRRPRYPTHHYRQLRRDFRLYPDSGWPYGDRVSHRATSKGRSTALDGPAAPRGKKSVPDRFCSSAPMGEHHVFFHHDSFRFSPASGFTVHAQPSVFPRRVPQ